MVGALKISFAQLFHYNSPLLLFVSAVAVSAWIGGVKQGFFATLLSVLVADYFLIEPKFTFSKPDSMMTYQMILFTLDCLVVSFLSARLRSTQDQAATRVKEFSLVQESLGRTENRFRKIFDSNMIGLLFSRLDGEVIAANDYVLNLIGYTREDLEKGLINWNQITPPEYIPQSLEAVRQVREGQAVKPFEKEYIRKDGSRVWVLLGTAPLENDTAVTFILDNTDRKKFEHELSEANANLEERVRQRTQELSDVNKALSRLIEESKTAAEHIRQSESFLTSVVENIPNMIFVKDAKELRFVRFNRAGEELLGYSRHDLIGKNDYDFFPKEQADFFTEKDRKVLEGRDVVEIAEEPIQTRKGIRYLRTKKIPIFDTSGQPEYLLGVSEDITDKKAAERQRLSLISEQLARSEAEKTAKRLSFLARATAALNESLDIEKNLTSFGKVVTAEFADSCTIDLLDEEGRLDHVVIANKDSSKAELGREWHRKYADKKGPVSQIQTILSSGRPLLVPEITEEMVRESYNDPQMRESFLEFGLKSMMVVPLSIYNTVVGMASFGRVQGQPRFTEMDLELAQDLARRVSFAVENARLFREAEEANRAKSAFLANMSHEIRTPLGAMLGFAELTLESGSLSDEQQNYVSTVIRNGRQLLRIVDEILDLSKVESDRIHIERLEFDPSIVIGEVTSLLEFQAREKKIDFKVQILSALPRKVISDPTRLRQILLNVIGNAIKFTEQGFVEVQIRSRVVDSDPRKRILEVIVTDTGIGIRSEHVNQLFQPFTQADSSVTRRFGGTGLGLFLSRKLARLLGGDLVLAGTELGRGSRFRITVEVEAVFEPTQRMPQFIEDTDEGKTKSQELSPAPECKVLVVDDAADNRKLVSLYLSKLGIQVDTAENGIEGVEKALKNSYDLVLMDIQMPQMDGLKAVEILRSKNYQRPIIALTAHAMKGDRERCLEKGFDDYLCKPLSKSELIDGLKRHLG